MKILTLLFIFYPFFSFGLEVESGWSPFLKKEVTITCQEDESLCDLLCQDQRECKVSEKVCRNCIGTDIYITHVFLNMGRLIVPVEEEVSPYELIDFLSKKQFATLTSKSIYNHVLKFNSKKLKRKFQKMCLPYQVDYPIVFFEVQKISRLLGRPKYIICDDKEQGSVIKRMGNAADAVEINNNDNLIF